MTTAGSGAVFFLGTRAHYQVLQQPESRSFDVENGNASTETIYQNPSVQERWAEGEPNSNYIGETNWNCYDNDVNTNDEKGKLDLSNVVKRRSKRSQSEATLCEREGDMRPALLNDIGDNSTTKPKGRSRISVVSYLWSLARRRRRLEAEQAQHLQHLESALAACTYRESCRCLDCQSRYFECDESEDYTSDESEYGSYSPQLRPVTVQRVSVPQYEEEQDEDDEVFIDTVPGDNTSTDMLLDTKEPPPAHDTASASSCADADCGDADADMQLEVAAGTPVLLNYLLTHPVTCSIQ